jgi:GT2 family glycosyltransferase
MRNPLFRSLRRVLLPPESRQELFLRTLYHRLNATPFFVRWQMRNAEVSYKGWREQQAGSLNYSRVISDTTPEVTFLLGIGAGDEAASLATLHSLQAMAGVNWQLLPAAADGINLNEISARLGKEDRLLTPVSISDLRLDLKDFPVDSFVIFCQAGDVFAPTLLDELSAALIEIPSADIIYTDCEYRKTGSGQLAPFFKPSTPSPELMFSVNYLSRSFMRASFLAKITIPAFDLIGLEYSLQLELVETNTVMHHIPRVLVRLRELPLISEGPVHSALELNFKRQGAQNVVVSHSAGQTRVNWEFGSPSVSLIILSHNHGAWLRNLVDSIFNITDYANYKLVIVENSSTEPEVLAYYDELATNERVTIVPYDQPFNYSEAINIGVAHSSADVVVLLNNDMLVTEAGWLRELVQWAVKPGIGVVGGKLLRGDNSIQHAGIILGMNGFIGHLYLNAPEHYHGLAGSVDWYRDLYAVTGACQAVQRDLFLKVGGYDERFRLAFGDIDFCLRVVKAGYRNLYNPFARLTHFEGGSRGYETPVKDILLAYDELLPWVEKHDPFYSPNLTYQPIPRCNLLPGAVDVRMKNIENRRRSLTKS